MPGRRVELTGAEKIDPPAAAGDVLADEALDFATFAASMRGWKSTLRAKARAEKTTRCVCSSRLRRQSPEQLCLDQAAANRAKSGGFRAAVSTAVVALRG